MTVASTVLQDYIFTSKYARYNKEKKRRETWQEAVDRVKDMMHQKYADKDVFDDIEYVYDMMKKKRILGSQRALQFGGTPALKKNARIFNCVASYCDRPRFFQEFFWLLLCGCGAGFSVQKHHVAKLPLISTSRIIGEPRKTKTFSIPDTIEGWADALGILLTTYWDIPADERFIDWVGYDVRFDFSLIREKGAPLSSGVGKAPGPDGLRAALKKIRELLDKFISEFSPDQDCRLRPIHVYDICMHTADAVLSGGVRRSATIALFSPDDEEMARAKIGNWLAENPQRARSNNSAILLRHVTTKKQFHDLLQYVKEYGEPGFVWADSLELIVNPCVEISFFCYDIIDEEKFNTWKKDNVKEAIICDPNDIGLESGWQGCNLTTGNCSKLKGTFEERKEQFLENVKAAAILGTFQAGFTNLEYLGKTSENIFRKEALLGVSMTGMMDNHDVVTDPEIQLLAAEVAKKWNKITAEKIGINLAARICCLKPEGTGTLILGSSAHGCHPHHYTRYLRAVQANTDENIYKYFKSLNEDACEPSKWSANKTDDVVFFPIEVPNGAKTKNMVPAIELLELVKSTQQHWVNASKRQELCTMPWLEHNVSNTVTVKDEEWDDVEEFIYKNRKYFAGISFVPDSADKDYPQAPNCAVYTPREIVREYGDAALWTSGLIELALKGFQKDLWDACSALLNPNYDPLSLVTVGKLSKVSMYTIASNRQEFLDRSKKFADKYFDGNLKKLTYCMKDVYNWKKWYDLNNSLSVVDYTQLIEEDDNTKIQEEVACSGGACTISI